MAAFTTVAALAFNDLSIFELAVACEVFGIDRGDMGLPNYDFFVCAAEEPPLRVKGGLFSMDVAHGLDELDRAGTIVVPAWSVIEEPPPEAALDALRRAYARGARILSVCSGAFVLAYAGLLDGRRATTHWMWADELARRFPAIQVDPRVLYVEDGRIFTSAGTAAGIDLCLHIVRQDFGAEVANMFARRMVVPPHRDGGQAQYVDIPMSTSQADDDLGETLTWIQEHLGEVTSVDDLAGRAHMSPRNFARRFVAVTGSTPHRWLICQRLLRAQRLLETTDLSVEVVAGRAGLGSAATLRQHFQRQFSTSPQTYRRLFRQSA